MGTSLCSNVIWLGAKKLVISYLECWKWVDGSHGPRFYKAWQDLIRKWMPVLCSTIINHFICGYENRMKSWMWLWAGMKIAKMTAGIHVTRLGKKFTVFILNAIKNHLDKNSCAVLHSEKVCKVFETFNITNFIRFPSWNYLAGSFIEISPNWEHIGGHWTGNKNFPFFFTNRSLAFFQTIWVCVANTKYVIKVGLDKRNNRFIYVSRHVACELCLWEKNAFKIK